MADEKPKKAKRIITVPPALVEALKRSSEGKATPEDQQLIVNASPVVMARARTQAGLAKARGGRSRVDVYVSQNGTTARKSPFSWKDFGALKKAVANEGKEVRIALTPTGVKPGSK